MKRCLDAKEKLKKMIPTSYVNSSNPKYKLLNSNVNNIRESPKKATHYRYNSMDNTVKDISNILKPIKKTKDTANVASNFNFIFNIIYSFRNY